MIYTYEIHEDLVPNLHTEGLPRWNNTLARLYKPDPSVKSRDAVENNREDSTNVRS